MKRLLLVVSLASFASTAHAVFLEKLWLNTINDVQYGLTSEERADIYLPTQGSNHPVVLMVHGGGWQAGDKGGYSYFAKKFAAKGIAAVAINYRLFKKTPDSQWPAQIEDVQLAVRWLRANARKYHIDSTRICVWGDSAGGHLALLLGSMKTTKSGDRARLYADQSPAVTCVIDLFGPTRLAAPSLSNMRDLLTSMFGGKSPEQDPKVWDEASPSVIANAASAPTLIVHGTTDDVVSFEQAKDLRAAFDKKGVSYEWLPFAGGHWFKGATSEEDLKTSITNQAVDYAVRKLHP